MNRTLRNLLFGLLASALFGAGPIGAASLIPDSPAGLLAKRIDAAVESRGIPGPREIVLDNPMLSLPKDTTVETMRLAALHVDRRTGRLMALFAAAAGKPQLRVTGRVFQLVDVLVPARTIAAGEIIAEHDLEHATVRRDPLAQEPLADAAAFIGKTARHALRAGEPVYAADLQVPVVIHRGELVTMVLQTPLMTVSAQGQALEDAVRGAAIRVTNTKSHRIVEAVATGPGMVAIDPSPAQ
jgi:flagellar basal body P-ring formation protein FlgA